LSLRNLNQKLKTFKHTPDDTSTLKYLKSYEILIFILTRQEYISQEDFPVTVISSEWLIKGSWKW